jgi:hypothetical protein
MFTNVAKGRVAELVARYEEGFGAYRDDEYHDPAQCPQDRRSLVAEIKVGGAAAPLAEHLTAYANGEYPLPFTEDLEERYHQIIRWDPHLPRQDAPSTT